MSEVTRKFNILCVSVFAEGSERWHLYVHPAEQSAELVAKKERDGIPDDLPKQFTVCFCKGEYPLQYVSAGLGGTCVALYVRVRKSRKQLKLYTDIPIGGLSVERLRELAEEASRIHGSPMWLPSGI